MAALVLESAVEFSYSQFLIYDRCVAGDEWLLWTDAHVTQGFARRRSTVSIGTISESGVALVRVFLNTNISLDGVDRAIAVPFCAPTGNIAIEGPEEYEPSRIFHIPSGEYSLTVAQNVASQPVKQYEEPEIIINVYFDSRTKPIAVSHILVADDEIRQPPEPLLEEAEVAHA